MSEARYVLAGAAWGEDAGSLTVVDVMGVFIADLPIRFMDQARCKTWDYVLYIIRSCVDEQEGDLHASDGRPLLTSADGTPDPIHGGTFTYRRRDMPSLGCTHSRGPEGKALFKAPKGAASEAASSRSTVSDSKRSSTGQSGFRFQVATRDGWCILTRDPPENCTAAHIVPFSRPDVYEKVLKKPAYLVDRYDRSAGFLVSDKYHHSFDRFEWSLFPQGDCLVVHFFKPLTEQDAALHGKVIEPTFFRVSLPAQRPDRRLLEWHYRQCAQMRFRGFPVKMTAVDAVSESSGARYGVTP